MSQPDALTTQQSAASATSADGEGLAIPVAEDPATVVVTRVVVAGREDEFRAWVVRLIKQAESFPGNLGSVVLSPPPGHSVFRLVHRFADETSLQAWEGSEARRELSAEADRFSTLRRQELTGMEAWFSVGDVLDAPEPKKWKMALVTFVVVYALTAVLIPREQAWLPESWSFYVVNVVTNVVIAVLLTFFILPMLSRMLRRWLY